MRGQRVGIVGTGLIGGSIGLRARSLGAWVVGYDRDATALERAGERGAIDERVPDAQAVAAQCDTLVVAVPVDALPAAFAAIAGGTRAALIIDVASVKEPLRRFAATIPHLIGTHPMAGRERGGIDAAAAALFVDATWAYVPHSDPALVARVQSFITAMGARPLEIEAGRHDAIVALTSHLPQVLSVALAAELARGIAADPCVTELCGPGMMSMLRLARSPAALWLPIVGENAVPLARHLRSLARLLSNAAEELDRGDTATLMSYFDVAREAAGALEKRFPSPPRS